MSALGEAIHADLAAKDIVIAGERVDQILADAGIASGATTGVPVRLRVRRIQVSGTKLLRGDRDDEVADDLASTPVPFDLTWSPSDGINGVGSERNLRGKSSVLHFISWALTGRCPLQPDVRSWIRSAEVEFRIDDLPIVVSFQTTGGVPAGTVRQVSNGRNTTLAAFANETEFESAMGTLMLERLRLEPIAMWANEQEISHAWPAYASALAVHADRLDPVVGNESVLGTRMLQMFVGTSWAPARAQAATALKAAQFERKRNAGRSDVLLQVADTSVEAAEARVAEARELVASFGDAAPDVDTVYALAAAANDQAQATQELTFQLLTARSAAAHVHDQLRTEQLRRNTTVEDALARRFFNAMTPTVCPRCSASVTQERRDAEGHDHACSLCASQLDLDAYTGNVVVASELSEDTRGDLVSATAALSERDEAGGVGNEPAVDVLDALRQAADEADAAVARLEEAVATADRDRLAAEAAVQNSRKTFAQARERLQAEIELARAEGALESHRQARHSIPSPRPEDPEKLLVLEAADAITARWLKGDQDPLLAEVSREITAARPQIRRGQHHQRVPQGEREHGRPQRRRPQRVRGADQRREAPDQAGHGNRTDLPRSQGRRRPPPRAAFHRLARGRGDPRR
ncbi:hypothetical protein [Amycolatopsis nalaikhensis]|uniref:Large ATP-binding protein n=1 Tax=Amycolatopsis nalaikhensis TaxID=715472 RepID=A0ABY8XZI0_9PSEU|nr:hypothetical protein [Amycolatopsis sp. 2-2]WIV60745.1 hypothetical protein QP939_20085 [Amycolatopsis sp. 2-2]